MDSPRELPREPTNDRRSVPRHIRDGEHDPIDEAMGPTGGTPAPAAIRAWFWIAGLALLTGVFAWLLAAR